MKALRLFHRGNGMEETKTIVDTSNEIVAVSDEVLNKYAADLIGCLEVWGIKKAEQIAIAKRMLRRLRQGMM